MPADRYHQADIRKMYHAETRLRAEIAREQVRRVSLKDYKSGAPHYEKLMEQVADKLRFQWPSVLTYNL